MVARAPRKRMYRTMQGRMIDIEKLRAANESTQAVGNMNVNAKGDVLGAGGKVVTKKAEVIPASNIAESTALATRDCSPSGLALNGLNL